MIASLKKSKELKFQYFKQVEKTPEFEKYKDKKRFKILFE
jgi:hypothetical protein